jgi:hypothetical protein
MSFRKHQPPRGGFGTGRETLSIPTVAVFRGGKQTQLSIPRAMLREAGLPDFPGARFDLFVGEGEDAGRIAIVKGTSLKAGKVGNGDTPTSVCIRTSSIGKAMFSARPVIGVTADGGELVLTLPADFPWTAPETTAQNHPRAARTNGQALAA